MRATSDRINSKNVFKNKAGGRQINPNTYHGFGLYFSMLTELFITEQQRP